VTGITINFGANAGDASEARIPVEVINANLETAWQGTTALSEGVTVPVKEPGVYLVRATLPSGELMTSTVRVTNDRTTTATLRPPRQSPNVELAWAYYMQPGPARSGWRPPRASGLESFRVADELAFGVEVLPQCDFWLLRRDNEWMQAEPDELATRPVPIEPGDPTAVVALDVSSLNAFAAAWVSVDWQDHQQLMAVPVWRDRHVRILILRNDRNNQGLTPYRVLVGGSHPQSEAILGFLTSGDFEAARRTGGNWIDDAELMLYDKVRDPIGAIVAGYFLLRAGSLDRLHDWTTNLANWFSAIPDGAVILGWHMALTNRWDLAEQWLTEAVARGIPLYTQGLRLLHDGLRILLTRGAKVEPQFDRVRAIAARAKWTSSVTCLVSTEPNDLQEPRNP
jgi:hypothetical protein